MESIWFPYAPDLPLGLPKPNDLFKQFLKKEIIGAQGKDTTKMQKGIENPPRWVF